MKWLGVLVMAVATALGAQGELKKQVIDYDYDGQKLKGFLVYDDAIKEKRPGVLIVHEWWGLNDYAKMRAEMIAKLGYVAFCVDMYGDGKTAEHPKDAGGMAGKVRENLAVWQGRATAGLKVLQSQAMVDPKKIAAIGYCFGGSTALQLSYSGAEIVGVVTFHAALPPASEDAAAKIKCPILICTGADDPMVPPEAIEKFKAPLTAAKVKVTVESYPKTVHSFTVKGVDDKGIKGLAYNADADEKSWKQMKDFFNLIFK